MGACSFTDAALYTGEGQPVGNAQVPPHGDLIRARPVCRLLFDADNAAAWKRGDVDLIYMLPLGPGLHEIAAGDLAEMVAVLDRGGIVAVHGPHDGVVAQASMTVLALAGGANA